METNGRRLFAGLLCSFTHGNTLARVVRVRMPSAIARGTTPKAIHSGNSPSSSPSSPWLPEVWGDSVADISSREAMSLCPSATNVASARLCADERRLLSTKKETAIFRLPDKKKKKHEDTRGRRSLSFSV